VSASSSMTAWKVMRFDPRTNELVSGSDSRLRFPAQSGSKITMPGQGIWLGLDRQYVEDYYASHEHNALLEVVFDPTKVLHGNLTDREPEFTVATVQIQSIHILEDED
jgi:hypothetical protein